jgi:hypothetical protein
MAHLVDTVIAYKEAADPKTGRPGLTCGPSSSLIEATTGLSASRPTDVTWSADTHSHGSRPRKSLTRTRRSSAGGELMLPFPR